jgi:hypothetical protein
MIDNNEATKLIVTNQTKQLLIIDWLTLNVTDVFKDLTFNEDNQFIANGFCLTLCDYRTRNFNSVAEIHLGGQKVATVTFDSSSKIMLRDQAHVKFENYLFYEGRGIEVAQALVTAFNIPSVKVSRLDLAVDGVFFHPMIRTFLIEKVGLELGALDHRVVPYKMTIDRVRDLDNIDPFQKGRENFVGRSFDSFTVGQKGSKKDGKSKSYRFARYYNKTRELESSGKEYIQEYFDANGFTGDVFRYEVQLSSTYLSEIEGFDFNQLSNYENLLALFTAANKQFFEFYYPTKNNVTHCERVNLFPSICTSSFYVRIKRTVKDKVRSIKIAIKKVVKEAYIGVLKDSRTSRDAALLMMHDLINGYELESWFMASWGSLWTEIKQAANKYNILLHTQQLCLWQSV